MFQASDPVVLVGMTDCASSIAHAELRTDEFSDMMILGLQTGTLMAYPLMPGCYLRPVVTNPVHDDTITKVIYSHFCGGVLSSSWDTTLKITNMQTNNIQRVLGGRRHGAGHQKAVFSFDWSEDLKLIASCGSERTAYIWNPFMQNPVYKLDGFQCALVDCCFGNTFQLITLDTMKTIKVLVLSAGWWCVQGCVHIVVNEQPARSMVSAEP